MKKLIYFAASLLIFLTACEKNITPSVSNSEDHVGEGVLKVNLAYETSAVSKALTDYTEVLNIEKAEHSIKILVFDKATGALNTVASPSSSAQTCSITVPVGEKTIYAVINGPELSTVTNVSVLKKIVDNLANNNINTEGFTMVGYTSCTAEASKTVTANITVKRLVSRIVLNNITNNLPSQYQNLTLDAVFLGNAYTAQTFDATEVSGMVNPNGYADQSQTAAIGKNSVSGSCPDYLYRSVSENITCGTIYNKKQCLYCMPNSSSTHTCLFVLATVGSSKYYYKVPLTNGLQANHTYTVNMVINNLGTSEPGEDLVKGDIGVNITISGWEAGDDYVGEF